MFDFSNIPSKENGIEVYTDTYWTLINLKNGTAKNILIRTKTSCEDFLKETENLSDENAIILAPLHLDYSYKIYCSSISKQRQKVVEYATSNFKTFFYKLNKN